MTMQRDRAVSSRIFNLTAAFVSAQGANFEEILASCGIHRDTANLADDDIRFSQFLAVLNEASRKLNCDDLGVRLAEKMPLRLSGIYHYLTTNAPVLRDEAIASCKYLGLITSAYTAEYSETGGRGLVTFNFRADSGARGQFVDLQIAAIVVRIRQILEDPDLPIKIELERPRPTHAAAFERVFGQDIQFGAPLNRISFAQRLLTRPIPGADPHLFDELQRVGDLLLKLKAREENIVEILSDFIVAALPKGNATPEAASQILNMTERTMQRTLAAANTTFSKLVDETRRRMAHHYLSDTDKPLTEVAFLLGYSELSAFSRAARTWFGQSPSAVRKASRPAEPEILVANLVAGADKTIT